VVPRRIIALANPLARNRLFDLKRFGPAPCPTRNGASSLARRRNVRVAPSALGASMDPDLLRRAANDACAVRTSEQLESAPGLAILQT
jgi:hypothetical protein